MKKSLFIICFCLSTFIYLRAQNTFPASGNVGVGTTNPIEKFQIGNTFTFHDGGHKVIGFNYAPTGGTDLSSSLYAAEIRFDPGLGNLRFGTSSSTTNITTTRLTITKDGNTGIGTDNPSSKLQVEGRTSVGSSSVLNLDWTYDANWGGDSSKWSGYIGFNAYRNNNDAKDNYYGANTYTSKAVFEGSNYGFRWLYRNQINADSGAQHLLTEYMRLDNNGNVGIGTTTPDAKLAVRGNIHTQEVKVDLLGAVAPDYVFYKDYDLKTLTEVENYITKKGHLPNIPSAKEMETNGLYLKEMNLKLLEKIEELTLYTIDQEKRIKQLENINRAFKTQKKKIELLEKQVELLLKARE